MRRVNGALILLAVVLVVTYLITRPHLGTVYVDTLSRNGVPIHGSGTAFLTSDACENDARNMNTSMASATAQSKDATNDLYFNCTFSTRLLWGW